MHALRGLAAAGLVLCLSLAGSWAEVARRRGVPADALLFSLLIQRYESLEIALPSHREVCYISDLDPGTQQGQLFYYLAEYSLAPRVVRAGTDCEITIGSFAQAAAAPAIIEQKGLRIVRRYDAGLMLLEHRR